MQVSAGRADVHGTEMVCNISAYDDDGDDVAGSRILFTRAASMLSNANMPRAAATRAERSSKE